MYKKEITYKDANRNEVNEVVEIDCTRFIPASKEEGDGFTQSDGYVHMVLEFAKNPESLGEMIDQTFDPEHRDEVLDWLKNK